MKWWKSAGAIGVALLLSTTVSAVPAAASVSQGYVAGAGALGDDWGDEGPLSRTSHAHSGATLLWQRVLIADGFLSGSGDDCWFGTATYNATRAWQRWKQLDDDGIVGPATFGKADDSLRAGPGGIDNPEYRGRDGGRPLFYRVEGGKYLVTNPDHISATYSAPSDCS